MDTGSVSHLARIVERRLADLDMNPFEAARRGGFLDKGFVNDILIGRKRSVRGENVAKLAKAIDVPEMLIVNPGAQDNFVHQNDAVDHNERVAARKPGVLIPEIDVRAGASFAGGIGQEVNTVDESGAIVSADLARGNWMIPDYYLASSNMRATRTHVLAIDGPSMIPHLNPTDRAIIDLDDTNPGRDGIFAIFDSTTDSVIVKNVQVIRGSDPLRIKCISSNPIYEPFEVILDGSSRIIGRVKHRVTAI